MKTLLGRTAFITGAGSGIGRAIAIALAREGANLVISDTNADTLAQTQEQAKQRGIAVASEVCDLTQPEHVNAMLDRLAAAGQIHILVNCAGLAVYGDQHLVSDTHWRRLMAVNLLAPMQITTRLIGTMARADEAHIVSIASVLGLVPFRRVAAYQASKYGLVGFMLALRADYQRKSFGVSVICPGLVRTAMIDPLGPTAAYAKLPRVPAWLCSTPERVAELTVRAIKRDRGLVVVSPLARLIWRFHRFFPWGTDFLLREGWRSRGRLS